MISNHSLLDWWDHHPGVQLGVVASLILAALVHTLRAQAPAPGAERGHDWAWGWVLGAVLLAGRWPGLLLPREFNQDESLLLAGAHALAHDPVFWRSVEGGTVGPLPFFALWPAGWWCDWLGYFPARFTAIVLLAAGLLLLHQCLALVLDRRSARLATLAAVAFESLTLALELVHYSTELVPVALLGAAAYAATRRWYRSGGPLWNLLGGALLGALPLAKLQAVPLGLVLGGIWLGAEFLPQSGSSARHRAYLLAGAVLPVLLFAVQISIAGEWQNVLIPYFGYNVFYSGQGLGLGRLVVEFFRLARETDSLLHCWVPGVALWILLLQVSRRGPAPFRPLAWIALGLCLVAFASAVYPGRVFLHYWQFVVLPLTLLLGVSLHQLQASAQARPAIVRGLSAGGAIALIGIMLLLRALSPNPYLGILAPLARSPRTELSERIRRHSHPGDTLAVWGWSSYVYPETGLLQITREACSVRSLDPSPYLPFYRLRYLRDFQRTQPTLFLDSVGPASTLYRDPAARHDRTFPGLAEEIRTHYTLVDEYDGARLYRRVAPAAGSPPPGG